MKIVVYKKFDFFLYWYKNVFLIICGKKKYFQSMQMFCVKSLCFRLTLLYEDSDTLEIIINQKYICLNFPKNILHEALEKKAKVLFIKKIV